MATVAGDGSVTYESDKAELRRAVAASGAVLLYVHGIIGDTEGMVRSSRVSGDAAPIGERYDVVLTFDYENLDTPIEENAASLRTMLREVGLSSGHGKRLDIVAHSMGGLVSRHLIELDGGVDVHRLITLGTPNGGSPWPSVQGWATAAVALVANGFIPVAWPITALAALVGTVEKVDTALDQMQAGSGLLRELAGAPDPGTTYDVIVGNRSLIESAQLMPDGRIARLLGRLAPVAHRSRDRRPRVLQQAQRPRRVGAQRVVRAPGPPAGTSAARRRHRPRQLLRGPRDPVGPRRGGSPG